MLSENQITQFRADGFLVVEDVLDQAQILDPVRAEYDQLLQGLIEDWGLATALQDASFTERLTVAYAKGLDWFQPMDISLPGDRIFADTSMHFGPAVFEMLRASKLLDIVQSLIGPEITSNPIQHVRIKPPEVILDADEIRAHVGSTSWHQDRAVALEEADQTQMVTVWIAVTDANVDNGCLQVIPNKHDAILLHCPYKQTAIAQGQIDTDLAVPLPVKSGGIVLLDPMVPHASLPNVSNGIRWSFDLRFNVTGQPTGRGHFPEFVARSAQNPESELTDWRAWRAMWEATRSRLAETSHIDIHRWRSDAPTCA